MIQTDLRRSIANRAAQFALFVRELKIIATQLVQAVDLAPTTAIYLVEKQNSLAQVKTNFQNWPYGSLTVLVVRQEIARLWPETYADAAAVQSELAGLNTMFADLTNALEAAIAVARSRGQLVDSNPTTNLLTYQTMSAGDLASLRAAAVTIRDGISGEVN